MSTPLPPDMAEHSSTLAGWLAGGVAALGALLLALLRDRSAKRDSEVAEALRDLGGKLDRFGDRFEETVREIFGEIAKVREETHKQSLRCAALHGEGPNGWNGHERRKVDR